MAMTAKQAGSRLVTLALALDLADEVLISAVEQIAVLRDSTSAFEPVLVTNNPRLEPIAQFGIPIEYVMPYDDWSRSQDPARWALYVEERLNYLVQVYKPGNVLILGNLLRPDGIDRNLYGSLLRLTPTGVSGRNDDDYDDNELLDEIGQLSMNLYLLEKKIDSLVRKGAARKAKERALGGKLRARFRGLNTRLKR